MQQQFAWSTHRRVKVDEDGTGDVFAGAGLGEKGLERTALAVLIDSLRVKATVSLEAVLEQVPGLDER